MRTPQPTSPAAELARALDRFAARFAGRTLEALEPAPRRELAATLATRCPVCRDPHGVRCCEFGRDR